MLAKRMGGLHPYVPGEQPKDRLYIKLNANENPYPPCPEVIDAITDFLKKYPDKLGLYPDPDSAELHKAIADMLNATGGILSRAELHRKEGSCSCSPFVSDRIPFAVTPDMIYCGNGSDEVLSFIFYAFFDSDRPLVLPQFTYSFYPVYAGFYHIPLDSIPLLNDWSLDTEKMIAQAQVNDSGMIFANPNAPTGRALTRSTVRQMLQRAPKNRVFVVDEAYVDFGGESCIPLLAEFDNLVIVRTFSKSLCAAGMRLGYVVSSPELIRAVTMVKNSMNHFPVDAVTQIAGVAACQAAAYYADCAKKIADERDRFAAFLNGQNWYIIPSSTNFLFVRKNGLSGKNVYEKIRDQGILVRHFASAGIEDFIRITIGTPQQMDVLQGVMKDL